MSHDERIASLNPCFSGTYSQRGSLSFTSHWINSLNPCFSGTYSQSLGSTFLEFIRSVLILVLVEHTLREYDALDNIDDSDMS